MANQRWITTAETGTPGPDGLGGPIRASDTPVCPGGEGCSPIIIDIRGIGIHLSAWSDGVFFDIDSDCIPNFISWTDRRAARSGHFLWLDRDGDGAVAGGDELFGDSTDQPDSSSRNGFEALRVFDRASNGGNEDGILSSSDSVFSALRLWHDFRPRNGRADRGEVRLLSDLVDWISLEYTDLRLIDEHGNILRWHGTAGLRDGRTVSAVDVLFIGNPVGSTCGNPGSVGK